jgi:hypothetical protein
MNRIVILILIALATFVLLLVINNSTWTDDIWMYLVGLAGIVVKGFQSITSWFKKMVGLEPNAQTPQSSPQTSSTPPAVVQQTQQLETVPLTSAPGPQSPTASSTKPESTSVNNLNDDMPDPLKASDSFNGLELQLLRYVDDGKTTLGLLYVDGKYFGVTLEDTYHEIKVAGETRIPAGTYEIKFQPELTDLTKTYRERYPDWFTNHLHLQNVPGFSGIYIHPGITNVHTKGCILVSNAFSVVSDGNLVLDRAPDTFKKLYLRLSAALNQGSRLRIKIKDENWITKIQAA